MKTKSVRPFGFRDELGYVFGDMAGSFVTLFVDAYFLTFCTYVLGISPAWMAGLFLVPRLVNRFGKRNVILVMSAYCLVLSALKVFVQFQNVWVYTAIYILAMIGQTAFTMLIWALVTDCLDYSEWKPNIRSDGSMYSLYTFSRKIGSTIASTGAASALAAIGYVSGTNVVQTAATVNNIY